MFLKDLCQNNEAGLIRYELHSIFREELTAIDYQFTIEGSDPDPLFVTEPDESALSKAFIDIAPICNSGCKASLCQTIVLRGKILGQDLVDIQTAIAEAYIAANPGMATDDFEIIIKSINNDLRTEEG